MAKKIRQFIIEKEGTVSSMTSFSNPLSLWASPVAKLKKLKLSFGLLDRQEQIFGDLISLMGRGQIVH